MIKVASLFKGLPRHYPDALEDLASKLSFTPAYFGVSHSFLWREGDDITNKPLDPRSTQNIISASDSLASHISQLSCFTHSSVSFLESPQAYIAARAKYLQTKYASQVLTDFNPASYLSGLYSFELAFNYMDLHYQILGNTKPTYCIALRTDLSFSDKLQLLTPTMEQLLLNQNVVFVPRSGHHHGGVSDQLYLSTFSNIKIVSSLYSCVESYLKQGCAFHPENLNAWHLRSNNISPVALDLITYIYRRGRPKHSGEDGILTPESSPMPIISTTLC